MRSESAPRNWLGKVLRNFVKLRRRREDSTSRRERIAARPEVRDATEEPGEVVARADLQQRIMAAVVELDEPYRSALLLRYMDELSAEEIARRQGVPSSTVRNRIRRGLAMLRRRFGGERSGMVMGGILLVLEPFRRAVHALRDPTGVLIMSKTAKITVASVIAVGVGVVVLTGIRGLVRGSDPETGNAVVLPETPRDSFPDVEGDEAYLPSSSIAQSARKPVVGESSKGAAPPLPAGSRSGTFLRPVRVVGPTGVPVPDAEVGLTVEDALESSSVQTDAFGECELVQEAGTYSIRASSPDIGLAKGEIEFGEAVEGEVFELMLRRPVLVHGLVLDRHGAPVPGATVRPGMNGITLGQGIPFESEPAVTDLDGRFELQLDPRATYSLRARRGEEHSDTKTVRSGTREVDVVLRLLGEMSIEGVVLLPDGAPAEGGVIRLSNEVPAGERFDPERNVWERKLLGAEGRFRFEIPRPGEYTLTVSSRVAGPVTRVVTVDEGSSHRHVEIALLPPITIAGRVRWEDGSPASGCHVVGWHEGGHDPVDLDMDVAGLWDYGYVVAEADDQGRFVLSPLKHDQVYSLSFQPLPEEEDARVRRHGIPAGTEGIDVVLTEAGLRGAFLSGSISAEGDAEALNALQCLVVWRNEPSDESWWTGGSNQWYEGEWRGLAVEEGRYVLEHLVPGCEYGLYLRAPGFGTTRVGPWVGDAEGTERSVVMSRPTSLEVQVIAADGGPASHSPVYLFDFGRLRPLIDARKTVFTDEDGFIRYEDVVPGTYSLEVKDLNHVSSHQEGIEIRPGMGWVTRVIDLSQ